MKIAKGASMALGIAAGLGAPTPLLAKFNPAAVSKSVSATEMQACIGALAPVTDRSIHNIGYEGRAGSVACFMNSEIIGLNVSLLGSSADTIDAYQAVTITPQDVKIYDYKSCEQPTTCLDIYSSRLGEDRQAKVSHETLFQDTSEPELVDTDDMPANVRPTFIGAVAIQKALNARLWQLSK